MRALINLKIFIVLLLSLTLNRTALADFETAAGYWKLLGQQKQVPQLLNLRGTEEIAILEVVGDCGGQLCSWGATRAELLYDANGRVIRWQAFLENGDDFHEFDSFLVNGELVMDYTGELGDTGNIISATLIFGSITEAEVAALAGQDKGGAAEDPVVEKPEDDPVADAGNANNGGANTGPSLEEQIVTGGLILGGLLLLNELLDNDGNNNGGGNAQPADPNDTCGMAALKPYMNKRYTQIPATLLKPGDRVYSDRDNITMDLRPKRLNVVYRHGNKRVFKLGCY